MLDTTITITVEQILIWVLLLVAIIAVIYVIVLLARAAKVMVPAKDTVEKLNSVLDDVKVITTNAKDSSEDARRALNRASDTLHDVARILDVNKGPIAAVTALIGAGTSLASLSKKTTKKRIGR